MRVLFDQGTPVPLRGFLNSHTVTTVYEKGWSTTRNGDLLQLADQEMFEVLLTTDQNLKYQQNLTKRQLAVVVLPNKLASDPKPHSQDRSSSRLNSTGRFHRNRFLTIAVRLTPGTMDFHVSGIPET